MQVIDNTDAPADFSFVPQVDHYGSPEPQPSYEIDPEDQHIADEILAMDPFNDVQGTHSYDKGWNSLRGLKVTALPEHMQASVNDQLARIPDAQREAKETELVAEAIRAIRGELRLKIGISPSATPYHHEQLNVSRDYREAEAKRDRLLAELNAISHHRTEFDEATGQPKATPVYRVSAERRRGIEAELVTLNNRMLSLYKDGQLGYEGSKRLKEALYESVQAHKELARQVSERNEAKARAAQINREERIETQARRIAALTRNHVA